MFAEICEVLLDAFIDSIKMLPVIFICYLLIELLEEKILNTYKTNRLLKSRFAPVVSAGFGLIPQCGFSVVATDLFSKRAITIGSLFAIFLATSDEALPLMLSDPSYYPNLFLILGIKFAYAVLVGLVLDLVFSKKRKEACAIDVGETHEDVHGCCDHHLEGEEHCKKRSFIVHPLLHSLKIFAFVLAINIIFGMLLYFVGENSIQTFMLSTGFFQPLLVTLVGMIPNCAASVIITELFMVGGISLGSAVAGLCANSGLALIMLFRLNKNVKENLAITFSLYMLSVLIGIVINLF